MRWYLVHTKPSSENIAEANLERQGYGVYLPRLAQSVYRDGLWQDRIVPLFPRYLFLHVNEGCQSLGPVRSSVGVMSLVRFGTDYSIVPDRIVRELKSREVAGSGLHRLSGKRAFISGDTVEVIRGPFGGLEGVFMREAGGDRVVVLLGVLGQEAAVRIPAEFVMPGVAA